MKTDSTSTLERLSLETLRGGHPVGTTGPRVAPGALTIGIVHFGIGAFHRAHQAVFTEDAAAASGDTRWGILGVTGRADSVVRQLQPQDCLYGVLQKGAEATSLRIVGTVRDVAWPARDSEKVVATLARATTHIATLTITEKGYLRAGDGIDLGLAVVQQDLALIERELLGECDLPASKSPIGLLVRGLARRFRGGAEPFTVLSCDNLVNNGALTRALVFSLVEALAPGAGRDELQAWLAASVSFPSSMVDRIAPATTAADRAEALGLLGLRDEALVVAEPFTQWVIEDDFAGPRPAWEEAGAILTTDVTPYERAKLRILNATHTQLAYLGALKGHATIAQAIADPALRAVARSTIDADILPTLDVPFGLNLEEYRDSVLERFTNPNLPHTTLQVGMDGSQKLPTRILGTAWDRLNAGHRPAGLALTVAAWITFVASTLQTDGPTLDDPLATRLQQAVASVDAAVTEPAALVDRFFALAEVFPPEVSASTEFRAAVVDQLGEVQRLVRTSA
ncbi:mannitol dehydrogenase family protein [Cryobacterium sp. TMS1-13-1]|uniref:mannitol dehydrogenase family protein n=1 Tax=Cryobacterium sp. TMS1-13-1 TaxID=1259220 RepID=UPI001F541F4F|nr:mannitol dehydrogenase family protein [Cryobacterium sp. TMS1-13-1]